MQERVSITMRFIGGKSLLLDNIAAVIDENTNNDVEKVCDLFTGSGVVASFLKQLGYTVYANDIMYMSYVLSRGLIELNTPPSFSNLGIDNVFDYLNNLTEPEDKSSYFIYNNYSPVDSCDRMYFQPKNAWKIDNIRQQIEIWFRDNLISESEYFYLLACLISAVPYVANITGVYAAYLKHWDKRTYKDLLVEPLPIIPSTKLCKSFNLDAKALATQESFDLVYIDTPYNQRQYTPNYHILETIAKYDYPDIHGVTGMRDYTRSDYCNKGKVANAFNDLFKALTQRGTKYAVVSYNNESLLSTDEMLDIFSLFGKVKLYEYPYRRYKSKIPNEKSGLKEQIYFVDMRGTL